MADIAKNGPPRGRTRQRAASQVEAKADVARADDLQRRETELQRHSCKRVGLAKTGRPHPCKRSPKSVPARATVELLPDPILDHLTRKPTIAATSMTMEATLM